LAAWMASRKLQPAPSGSQDPSVGIGERSSSSSAVAVTLMAACEASLRVKTRVKAPAARSINATEALRMVGRVVSISLQQGERIIGPKRKGQTACPSSARQSVGRKATVLPGCQSNSQRLSRAWKESAHPLCHPPLRFADRSAYTVTMLPLITAADRPLPTSLIERLAKALPATQSNKNAVQAPISHWNRAL